MTHRVYGILIYLYDHDQTSIADVTSKTAFLGKTVFTNVFYVLQTIRNTGRQKKFFLEKFYWTVPYGCDPSSEMRIFLKIDNLQYYGSMETCLFFE